MKYTKPEVIVTGTATVAIKGQTEGSKVGISFDSQSTLQNSLRLTANAYEADE
jgi:hypothetical protein